jgi:hypothetical protein
MEKKITPPDGFEFKFINETEVQLVPKQQKYPMKIEDIQRRYMINHVFKVNEYSGNYNHCSSEATAEKFAAMIQLKELCDAWNRIDNFTPNFYGNVHWCIEKWVSGIELNNRISLFKPLAFKDKETAKLFLTTFRDLIEQAGDLI